MTTNHPLLDPLTPREQVILRRLGEDRSNAEIAAVESLAVSSVKWYVQQICSKLGVKTRHQAVTRARELGLLEGGGAPVLAVEVPGDRLPTGSLPTGTVTFLFTDIEGSTPLWEQMPEAMGEAVAQHHRILRQAIESNGGQVFQVIGDAFQAAFRLASDALCAALAAQRGLQSAAWGAVKPIKVRMGLHTGPAERDPYGSAPYAVSHTLNRAARVMASAHGGQIVMTQETAALVEPDLPDGARLRDLGEHQLKGMQRLEHIYQLTAPELPGDFPPLVTEDEAHDNLPRRRTPYVGRAEVIAQVRGWLEESPLVTLTGSGGIGKTSLSVQVAEASCHNHRFPDGAWLVELAPVTDPALVAKSVAAVLGLQEETSRPIQDTLVDYLRKKSALIILDNCEHLLDACARLADQLLGACPNLRLLATSREPLNVTGERVYRVPSMQFPDPDALPDLETFRQYEAVRLFVERAGAIQPGFAAAAENARAIAQVCSRLDGIPLAIELAAARLNVLSIDQLAGRLDQAFRLLTGGSRTALPRQQTLRAAIDWSYQLLNEAEKTLLRRLSVFSGTFDLDAAEAVCAFGILEPDGTPDTMLDLLSALVNKSLVTASPTAKVGMRYRLLEIVRQYAREKLFDAGESQLLRDRHLEYFTEQAQRSDSFLVTAMRPLWTAHLQADSPNLRDALDWAYQDPATVEKGLRIATAVAGWHFSIGRSLREDIDWLEKGITMAEGQQIDPLLLAKAMRVLMIKYMFLKDLHNRMHWAEKCMELCRKIGPAADQELCVALLNYSSCYAWIHKGDLTKVREWKDESVRLARGLGPSGIFLLAVTLDNRSKYGVDPRQRHEDAMESYRLFHLSGNRWMAALPLWQMGGFAELNHDYAEALRCYDEALSLSEEVEDPVNTAFSFLHLGRLHRKMGNFDRAIDYHMQYIRMWIRMGGRERLADGLGSIAVDAFYLLRQMPEGGQAADGPAVPGRQESLLRVVTLIAATEAHRVYDYDFLFEADRGYFDQALETARRELGEHAVQNAWERGKSLTPDDAVALTEAVVREYAAH